MKEEIIIILTAIAKLLEIKGESYFKFAAYQNAADLLRSGDYDLESLVINKQLSELKGFGKALTEKISEYVLTGKMSYYDKLRAEYPESLIEIMKIDGLGPKKVNQIYTQLNIATIDNLAVACINGKLLGLKGFTEKGIQSIQKSIN